MTEQKYLAVEAILGAPNKLVRREMPYATAIWSAYLTSNGTGKTGSMQTIEIVKAGIYMLTAQGASGSLGTHVRSGVDYTSDPGHAAIVKTRLFLNKGDKLLIIVGQQGSNTLTDTVTDGVSGGGGGGTFVFREIATITDTSYQIAIAGKNYECLAVAAGGGGTQDNCHHQSSANGYDASTLLYSLNNFKSYSATTRNPTTFGDAFGVLSLKQIATYAGEGGCYARNKNYCYGGYGCGGCSDDSFTCGGGWCNDGSYSAASWAKTGGTLTIANTFSDGSLTLECVASSEVFAWWTPVIDRTLADCVYGNPRGCIDQTLLNRLEANIEYIEYKLAALNFVSGSTNKSDVVWTRKLYVLYSDMERIRSNIEILRNSGIILADTPIPQKILGCEQPGYELINEWEHILYDIKAILTAIERSRLYAAQPLLYCGFAIHMLNTSSEEDMQ